METITVLQSLVNVLFPTDISLHFEVSMVQEYPDRIEIRKEELQELVPEKLYSKEEVVLDGFCNPLEWQSFPLKGKPFILFVSVFCIPLVVSIYLIIIIKIITLSWL